MRIVIDNPKVEALARAMLRETIERSGWYPYVPDEARAERIERDVDLMWRLMAEAARERLEQDRWGMGALVGEAVLAALRERSFNRLYPQTYRGDGLAALQDRRRGRGGLMPEDANANLRDDLLVEALARTREGIRLAMKAQEFESQGQPESAEATREVARQNELERIKLREKLDTLDGCA